MKKLVFMFVAMAAISFASCGNSDKTADANDSIKDTVVADSANNSIDTVASDTAATTPAAVDTTAQA